MKDYLIGFAIAILLALGIFFFYFIPKEREIKKEIQDAYLKGKAECETLKDTVLIKGDEKIVYRDVYIESERPADITYSNAVTLVSSSFDTNFVSGKDSIEILSSVDISIEEKAQTAKWTFDIEHKDYEQLPDTVIVTVPKYIETIKPVNNWLLIFISFITGGITVLLSFLLS